MEKTLQSVLLRAREEKAPVRDICFSGNGEPTLSPDFAEALEIAAALRDREAPAAALVTITNGSGLSEDGIFEILRRAAAGPMGLDLWLKLDAGTEAWYAETNRSSLPFAVLTAKIREFTGCAPVTIQTMLCAIRGKEPPPEEAEAWTALTADMARSAKGRLKAVQIYGKARPAPEDPLAEALPAAVLEVRAAFLRRRLAESGRPDIPVEVFP
jgi:histidinol dehydrogenase